METKFAHDDDRQRQVSSNIPQQRATLSTEDSKPVTRVPGVATYIPTSYVDSKVTDVTGVQRLVSLNAATITNPSTAQHMMMQQAAPQQTHDGPSHYSVSGRSSVAQQSMSSLMQTGVNSQSVPLHAVTPLHQSGVQNVLHDSASGSRIPGSVNLVQPSLSQNFTFNQTSSGGVQSDSYAHPQFAAASTHNYEVGSTSSAESHYGTFANASTLSGTSNRRSGTWVKRERTEESDVKAKQLVDDKSARSSPNPMYAQAQARSARSTPSATNSSRMQHASQSEASGSPQSASDTPATVSAAAIALLRQDNQPVVRVTSVSASGVPRRSGVISRVDPRANVAASGVSRPSVSTATTVSASASTSAAGNVVVTSGPNGVAVFPCPQCGKQFTNSSAIAKHKLTHSDERRYACPVCSKAFKRQDHLNGHMMTHQDKKPHQCTFPGCAKSYSDARSLRRHLEHQHQNDIRTIISNVAESPADSTDADDTASWPPRASAHLSASQPNLAGGSQPSAAESDGETETAPCRSADDVSAARLLDPTISSLAVRLLAEAQTAPRNEVLKHLDELHPQQCNVCRKRFKNQAALNGHMRLHGGFAGLPVTGRSPLLDSSAVPVGRLPQNALHSYGRVPAQQLAAAAGSSAHLHSHPHPHSLMHDPRDLIRDAAKFKAEQRAAFKRTPTQLENDTDSEASLLRVAQGLSQAHTHLWQPRTASVVHQSMAASPNYVSGASQIDSLIAAAEMMANDETHLLATSHADQLASMRHSHPVGHSLPVGHTPLEAEVDDGVATGGAYNEVEIVGVTEIVDTDLFNTHDDFASSPAKAREKHDSAVSAYESVTRRLEEDLRRRRLDAAIEDESNQHPEYGALECDTQAEPTLWQCVSLGQRGVGVRSPSGTVYRWTPPIGQRVGYAKPHLLPQSHWQLTTALNSAGAPQQRCAQPHCADTITALALKNVFHNVSLNPADETWRKRHYSAADIFADELDYSFPLPLASGGSSASSSLLESIGQPFLAANHTNSLPVLPSAITSSTAHSVEPVQHHGGSLLMSTVSATLAKLVSDSCTAPSTDPSQTVRGVTADSTQAACDSVASQSQQPRGSATGTDKRSTEAGAEAKTLDGTLPQATAESDMTHRPKPGDNKLKRGHRPEPLQIPAHSPTSFAQTTNENWVPNSVRTRRPSFGYQSWLRAPRSFLSLSAGSGWPAAWNDEDETGSAGSHGHPDPHAISCSQPRDAGFQLKATQSLFTPPPILSPFRTGSGLYWNVIVSKSRHASAASDAAAPPTSSGFESTTELPKPAPASGAADVAVSARPCAQATQVHADTNLPPPLSHSTRTKQLSAADTVATRDSIDDVGMGSHADEDDNETVETDIEPHINIGSRHQADVPELRPAYEALLECNPPERLLLDPAVFVRLGEMTLDAYLDTARSAVLPGNGVNTELALRVLNETNGNVPAALELLLNASAYGQQLDAIAAFMALSDSERHMVRPLRSLALSEYYSESRKWTAHDIAAYSAAFKQCGDKEFGELARATGRSMRECIEFYFVWKKAFPDEYARLRRARRRKEKAAESCAYNLRRDDSTNANANDEATPTRVACMRCDAVFTSESVLRRHMATAHAPRSSAECENDASQTCEENSTLNGDLDTPDDDAMSVNTSYGGAPSSDLDAPAKQLSVATSCVTDESTTHSQTQTATTSRSHAFDAGAPTAKRQRKQAPTPRTGPFTCRICGRQFEKVKSCNAHMKSHRYHAAAAST